MAIEKRIMIIDESLIHSNIISSLLLENNYPFNKYNCIFKGIEELVTTHRQYDLLLISNLTKSNLTSGYAVKRIKEKDVKLKTLPIIYVTDSINLEDIDFYYYGGNSIVRSIEPKNRFLQKIEYLTNSN